MSTRSQTACRVLAVGWVLVGALVTSRGLGAQAQPSPRDGWAFTVRDFVIAAWNPPADTDAEYRMYRQAGFNLVMSPRHKLPDRSLALAQKHGLRVMVDTYTPNARPWGGTAAAYTPHRSHHPATLPELKWLHARYGTHPALAGYLLGDDIGAVPQELIDTTRFLRRHAPHLFPWVCQCSHNPASLVEAGNPIGNLQVYPTLYEKDLSAPVQGHVFCQQVDACRKDYRRHDLVMWPMFNVVGVRSDSLVRFQVYASLAYGAQGLWYYTYRNGLQKGCGYKTVEQVRTAMEPTWAHAAEANRRVGAWGTHLLGRWADGVFATGQPRLPAIRPATGRLIEHMSDDLLVGILTKPGASPLAMVVDRRVDKKPGAVPERQATVRFAPAVTGVDVLEGDAQRSLSGRTVALTLRGGDGQLLALRGIGLKTLTDQLVKMPVGRVQRGAVGPDGLLLHLTFDRIAGRIAHDTSGVGNDAWVDGARRAKGKFGGALSFGDKGVVCAVWDACLPATDAMSIACWVRPHYPAKGYGAVVYVGTGRGGTDRFEFGFGPDDLYPVISNRRTHSHDRLYVSDMRKRIPEGTWGHIAVCAGPNGATTYVNGYPARQTDYAGRFDFTVKNIHVGRRAHERYEGQLDDLKIWNRCLSADQVRTLVRE